MGREKGKKLEHITFWQQLEVSEFEDEAKVKLFFQGWQQNQQEGEPQAVICLVHGLGEHSGRYREIAQFFSGCGFSLLSYDLYGHGRSSGQRGTIPSYEFMISSVEELVKTADEKFPTTPLFLYGHSLGGNLALNYALRRKTAEIQGLIMTSPWLRLKQKPVLPLRLLANLIYKINPDFTLPNGIDSEDLSQSEETRQNYEEDELVHDRISVRLFIDAARAGEWALENYDRLKLPLLLMHGDEDNITDPAASRQLAEKLLETAAKCQYIEYEGLQHELHKSSRKQQVFQQIKSFMSGLIEI